MKTYRVGIVLSTTYVVEAEDEDEAEELAMSMAEDDYCDLNVEKVNFVEEEENEDEVKDDDEELEEEINEEDEY